MTRNHKTSFALEVQIFENDEPLGLRITLTGRESWAMRKLIAAKGKGISSLDHVGPRLSHYIFRLRGYGFAIETVHTKHGGDFPGHHAVYRLHSDVRVISDASADKVAA